jgi:hypothetical protein
MMMMMTYIWLCGLSMSRASADRRAIESWFRAIHFSVVIIIVIDSVHHSVVDTGDNAELAIYYEPYVER